MAYAFKYYKGVAAGHGGEAFQQSDAEFAKLRDVKGEFYTALASYMFNMRVLHATMNEVTAHQSAVISATLVSRLLAEKYGEGAKQYQDELMQDVERITSVVFLDKGD